MAEKTLLEQLEEGALGENEEPWVILHISPHGPDGCAARVFHMVDDKTAWLLSVALGAQQLVIEHPDIVSQAYIDMVISDPDADYTEDQDVADLPEWAKKTEGTS